MKKNRCYSIMLTGQGDIYITLVNKETWDWITKCGPIPIAQIDWAFENWKKDLNPNITREEVEKDLLKQKADNDKALSCHADYGKIFTNLKDYTKFVVDNSMEIVEDYEGYIY